MNEPPSPIVEDISSAIAIHRASLDRDRKRGAQQAESPLQVLSTMGKALKRIFSPQPPPQPTATPIVEPPANDRDPATLTIAEMLAAWRIYAGKHYPAKGEFTMVEAAIRPLEAYYGGELVADFGPKKLKAVQELMVKGYQVNGKQYRGASRRHVNAQTMRIKRVFKWAVSDELAPAGLAHSLSSVAGLKYGRTIAPELAPIGPVDEAVVEATLPHLSAIMAAMVKLQLLTGMRPGEARKVRPCDVDRSGDVWKYRPRKHKTEHWGKTRVIFIGPRAQEVLLPYLDRDPESFYFSARESRLWWFAKRRLERKSAVQPSQLDRSKDKPQRAPGKGFSRIGYSQAIARACKTHDIPHWHPNQLRHTAATKVRAQFGLEAAQAILGHSRADVTQVYAERDSAKGIEAMGAIG